MVTCWILYPFQESEECFVFIPIELYLLNEIIHWIYRSFETYLKLCGIYTKNLQTKWALVWNLFISSNFWIKRSSEDLSKVCFQIGSNWTETSFRDRTTVISIFSTHWLLLMTLSIMNSTQKRNSRHRNSIYTACPGQENQR